MAKVLKNRKSKEKIENGKVHAEVIDLKDSLANLLVEGEKLKYSLYQQKLKSPTLSITASVFSCVTLVLSEYGEESIKRQRYKNDVTDCKSKEEANIKWTNCVKVLEELITCQKGLDQELCSLILLLIAQVHERQSLKIVNNTVLHEVIGKMVTHMEHVEPSIKQIYTRCLASFILGNLTEIPKEMFSSLSGAFFRASERHLEIKEPDLDTLETLKYCISGLTNLCYLVPASDGSEIDDFLAKRFQTCGRFFQLFVLCLERLPSMHGLTQVSMFRMQHQCLHGLNYVSQRPHGLSLDNTERLLTILRVYCGFGMFRYVRCEANGTFTTDKDEHGVTRDESCDTDIQGNNHLFSRGESGEPDVADGSYRPMRKWEVKTRRLALELLLKVLAKCWRKVSTIVWEHFMPVIAWGSRRRFNLLNVLEMERDCGLKLLVLKSIQQCVINCKDLLASAQHQPAPSTFVSRSHNLACVIDELHERLLGTLATDKSVQTRMETLNCLLALIHGVPYHRLRPTIVHSVVHGLRQVLLESHQSQTSLRCLVLDCFSSLVAFESVSTEMRHLLLRPTVQTLLFGDSDSAHGGSPSWLVQLCVRLAHPALVARLWTSPLSSESWGADMDPVVAKVIGEGDAETDGAVRCQALMTVGAMLSQHGSLIKPSLETLKRTLLACLHESLDEGTRNPALCSHALRVFSGFLSTLDNKKAKRYLGIVKDSQTVKDDVVEEQVSTVSSTASKDTVSAEWWSSFLAPVVQCLEDRDEGVRASAAQCMSLMGEAVLEHSVCPEDRRRYYELLLGLAHDPSVAVSCQAVWALGYWAAMRPLNVDASFLPRLVHACSGIAATALTDPSAYVICANAVWSMSNAVEVLVAHQEGLLACCKGGECAPLLAHYLVKVDQVADILRLLCDLCSLKKAGQVAASARIHENAIRGLGYICRFLDDSMVQDELIAPQLLVASDAFCKAIQLPDKAGRVKVKWNACLSASHAFRNSALTSRPGSFALPSLVDALVGTVATDRYFKVRNNSLLSLLVLVEASGRVPLGPDLVPRLLQPLADALVSVEERGASVPFSEVHRHCLCLYLLQLLLLRLLAALDPADLPGLPPATAAALAMRLPETWRQLGLLNRAFSKHALLASTLMVRLPVAATAQEVDLVLAVLRARLDRDWPSSPSAALLDGLHGAMVAARGLDDPNQRQQEGNMEEAEERLSDEDGLLTRRAGASLLFSQIYD